jgi:hypothetical protein
MKKTLFIPAVANLIPSPPPPRKYNYTVADLIVKTTGTVAMRTVEYVTFRSAKYKYDRLGRITLEVITVTRIPGENQRLHKMQWYSRDPHYSGKLSNCKTIMFSCDCLHFKFVYEYAFWSRGISEIKYSNGGYPLVTNPRRRIALCKHGLRSGLNIITKKL